MISRHTKFFRGGSTPPRLVSALCAAALAALFLIFSARSDAAARYVFLFIGDGMGPAQVNLAEAYIAGMRRAARDETPRESQLVMSSLPVSGMVTTASKSGVTDSAAAATAIATGQKTTNGAIACDPQKGASARWDSILDDAHKLGMKTGIITSSFLQDATPAAFCAHAESRKQNYELGREMLASRVDLLGGGGFRSPRGRSGKFESLYDIAARSGWHIADSKEKIDAAPRGQRTLIVHPSAKSRGTMPYSIDDRGVGLRLSDFTRKAIQLLDSDEGFLLVVEGGLIDLACHANDATSTVYETADFDEAIRAAVEFKQAHDGETLIVVTADHETGGLKIRDLDPDMIFRRLSGQRGSYLAHEGTVSPSGKSTFDQLAGRASAFFGTRIDATDETKDAFKMSMTDKKSRPTSDKSYRSKYATYDPFTVACLHQMNARAGVTWERFYHSGQNVPIWAAGVGEELFSGTIDNTQIRGKIREAMRR